MTELTRISEERINEIFYGEEVGQESRLKLVAQIQLEADQKVVDMIEGYVEQAVAQEILGRIERYKTPRRYSSRPFEEFRIPIDVWQALKQKHLGG